MRVSPKPLLSGNMLKLIAIIAMLVDHVAWAFVDSNTLAGAIMHTIGRFTAPIMFFFLVQGYLHTSNIRKYVQRLLIFTIISQLPYSWFVNNAFMHENTISFFPLSIIYTLLVSLIMLIMWDKFPQWQWRILIVSSAILLTVSSDWGMYGPAFVLIFYVAREYPRLCWLMFTMVALVVSLAKVESGLYAVIPSFVGLLLAGIIINLYNGIKGRGGKIAKWSFYVFYPLHLLALTIILLVL